MKKLILNFLILLVASASIDAAAPNWAVNPSDYSNSMVIVGVLNLSGGESIDENDLVAAFVGNEVRGVANVQYEAAADRYIAYLIVYADESGEDLTFKMYDASQDMEIDAQNSESFVINDAVGNLGSPYIWSDVLLSDEAEITSFSFAEEIAPSVIDINTIEITVVAGTDVSTLVATFTSSTGARVVVEGSQQTSGITSNDFSIPLEYVVTSESGERVSTYTVTVTITNDPPTDLGLTVSEVSENSPINTVVGSLTVEDDGGSHTFFLVAGDGDDDNDFFEIVSGEIRTKAMFNFEEKSAYSIRLMVEDDAGQSIEKVLTIDVLDVNEAPTSIEVSELTVRENGSIAEVIATISTTDPDQSETFSYALSGGLSDNVNFSIDGSNLTAATSFDFEEKNSYEIELTVTDSGDNIFSEVITISISDQNDSPTDIVLDNQSVFENLPFGSVIGNLSTVDQDVDDVHQFTLVSGEGDTDNSLVLVSGSKLLTNSMLDFELKSELSIRLMVEDSKSDRYEKVFFISVTDANDSPTDLLLSNTSVIENTSTGSVMGQLSVLDADPTTMVYELIDGQNDNDHFVIEEDELRLALLVDFESKSQLIVDVLATDIDNQSVSNRFLINVLDENEAPFVLNPIGRIDKVLGTNIELSVGGVFADIDAGDELTLFLTVDGSSSLPQGLLFDANRITLNSELMRTSFEIVLTATDMGGLIARDTILVSAEIPSPLGLEKEGSDISIYPNPVRSHINLFTNDLRLMSSEMTIWDMNGNRVVTGLKFSDGLDVSQLKTGVYLLELRFENEKVMLRFLKR